MKPAPKRPEHVEGKPLLFRCDICKRWRPADDIKTTLLLADELGPTEALVQCVRVVQECIDTAVAREKGALP